MNKRTIIIIGAIALVLIIAAILLYIFVFSQPQKIASDLPPLTKEEQQRLELTQEEREAGVTEDEKIRQLVEEKRKESYQDQKQEEVKKISIVPILDVKSISPTLSADLGKLLYFSPAEKEFFVADLDGSKKSPITSSNLEKVYDITWSKQKDKTILTLSDNKGVTKNNIIFNIDDQDQTKIDPSFESPTFSPDGEQIAYLFIDKDNNISNISTADLNGSNWQTISPYESNNAIINWGLESQLVYYSEGNTQDNNTVFSANTIGKKFKPLTSAFGQNINLSQDKNKYLFSGSNVANAKRSMLQVLNLNTNKTLDLNANTYADKCVWLPDNQNVICAVPENASTCIVSPDAYNEYDYITKDSFYKIDTQIGSKTLLASSDKFNQDYDVFKPFMLGEKIMYFTRRQDGLLYSLVIP